MKKMVVFLTPRFLPLNILKLTADIRYKFSQRIIYFGQLIVFVQKKKPRLHLLKKKLTLSNHWLLQLQN
jgi:hypothetical protein